MSKVLTKGDLYKLEKEIDEADEIIDLCVPGRDDDVLAYWETRLDEIEKILEDSLSNLEG